MDAEEGRTPEDPGAEGRHSGAPAENPPIQISLAGSQSGRYRITIEALNGEAEAVSRQTFAITVPAQEAGASEVSRPAGDEPASGRLRGLWAEIAYSAARLRQRAAARGLTLGLVFFGLSIAIYLLVRLVALESFPIYFFTDEAVQTVLAADLVRDNFFGEDKVLLPTFFKNVYQYNLSVSVYLQVLPYLFFGKSLFVTRAVSVLVSLLVPLSVGLALRDVFKSPYWWSGALVASLAPAWFLHSRTAFETVMAVSFYSAFLYLYLLYRCRSPRYLYGALGMAALTFYTYSPAQVYMGVTCLLLLLVDARYHWQHRRVAARAAILGILLALPYIRFRFNHPEAAAQHLAQLSSYWVESIPLLEKFRRFASEYLYGLSPGYWFIPHGKDLPRHVMKDYGHLLRPMLPFMILGLLLALRRLRQPPCRILLIALLAAPAGAAIVEIGITRMLVFVVPASILITLGIAQALLWLERLRLPRTVLAVSLFSILGLANLWMFRDALANGPTWYTDYGLHGMQYGARQVFGAVDEYLEEHADAKVYLATSWANGADLLARFFLPDPLPLEMAGIDSFLREARPLDDDSLFVLPANEYAQAVESEMFTDFRVERLIQYPDGEPGFYLAHFRYRDDIDQILAEELAVRKRLTEETMVVDGDQYLVAYSFLDMGQIADVFDGDELTVARTGGVNPFVIELVFDEPREVRGYDIIIGSADGELRTYLYPDESQAPLEVVWPFEGSIEEPLVSVDLEAPVAARRIRIEVHDHTQGEIGHVHVWELRLR